MVLEKYKAPVQLKLAALWAALMFCYIYADFFGLFTPGRLAQMNQGVMSPLGTATPYVLLGTSIMMAIPSLMVFGALVMSPGINRWANISLGLVYACIILLTMMEAPLFYIFFGVIEVGLSFTIMVYAFRWPRTDR